MFVFICRCPEYDTYEGNKYTMAGTLHTCSGGGGYWDNCDRNGCQTNIYNIDPNLMCPEDRYGGIKQIFTFPPNKPL